MMPTGKAEPVQVTVGLFFTSDPPANVPYILRLGSQSIDIPAGKKDYTTTDTYALPVAVETAFALSVGCTLFALFVAGALKTLMTGRPWLRSGLETVLVGAISLALAPASRAITHTAAVKVALRALQPAKLKGAVDAYAKAFA